jgi:hypothetical protein
MRAPITVRYHTNNKNYSCQMFSFHFIRFMEEENKNDFLFFYRFWYF